MLDNENYKTFAWWAQILVLKMLAMVVLTARQRIRKNVWISSEDAVINGPKAKVSDSDPDVERVRKAHRNDLENILPWFICTALWLTTSPSPFIAGILIKTFAISRIVHTIVYVVIPVRQPARAIAFFVGTGAMLYQAISTIIYYA